MTPDDRAAALRRAEAFGVDLATLRDRLRLTPADRLRRHALARARAARFRAARDADRPAPRPAR